jgi:hypothetical protein
LEMWSWELFAQAGLETPSSQVGRIIVMSHWCQVFLFLKS